MVKCIECGYLAARHHETRLLEEVEENYRNTGICPHTTVGVIHNIGIRVYEGPICFVRFCNLKTEYGTNKDVEPTNLLSTLRKDRECDSFTEWQQGFNPKEHREMMDREKMLKWQADREDADRTWHSQEANRLAKMTGVYVIIAAIIGAGVVASITYLLSR